MARKKVTTTTTVTEEIIDDAPRTIVTLLLDKSGSMESKRDAAIEAYNAYISGLKEDKTIVFNFIQFDSFSTVRVHHMTAMKDVPDLNRDSYVPQGGTPLLDAAADQIRVVDEQVRPGDKVVFCIQTDGEENSSRRHSWHDLNDMIKARMEKGWAFNFMGCGIDAYQQSSKLGIGLSNTVAYSTDLNVTRSVFQSRGLATVNYATGATADMTFTASEKMAAGDVYDPELKKTSI